MNYNWGIIGTGRIAELFADALSTLKRARLYAVGSRSMDSAKSFQSRLDMEVAYGTYAELYEDPEVHIVYIATPHNYHFQNARDALKAGKHVLCEKPFTLNATQAKELRSLAKSKNLFLMEAMWNRFQPWYAVVNRIIERDDLGTLYHLKADLSFHIPYDPEHRVYDPNLAGGSLLDLGVYPISLASLFMGKPLRMQSEVHRCDTGVDDQVSLIFTYEDGATAELSCSSRYTTKNNATLHGSKGYLEIHGMLIRPDKITVNVYTEEPEVIATPYAGNGYQYQAEAVMDMIDSRALEHPLMPLRETIEIMETMDEIRRRAGIHYPEER